MFAVGAVAADALPATARDAPAAPKIGNDLRRPFTFDACLLRAIRSPPFLPTYRVLGSRFVIIAFFRRFAQRQDARPMPADFKI
jgi:hypothetical protein